MTSVIYLTKQNTKCGSNTEHSFKRNTQGQRRQGLETKDLVIKKSLNTIEITNQSTRSNLIKIQTAKRRKLEGFSFKRLLLLIPSRDFHTGLSGGATLDHFEQVDIILSNNFGFAYVICVIIAIVRIYI